MSERSFSADPPSSPIAEMSRRQLDMLEILHSYQATFARVDVRTAELVRELPRVRFVAYAALVLSLATAGYVGCTRQAQASAECR